MKLSATMILWFGLAGVLATPHSVSAGQNPDTATHKADKADKDTPPSAQDIANAKSQGLVWVNTSSRVFHKDGENYGKTKHGKFMTEAEARQQGFRAAKEPENAKSSAQKKSKKDQSGLDDSANTHSSTPPKQ
jgi:hypothetical protein